MVSKLSLTSALALPNSKHKIPQLGFGVYQSPPSTCANSCLTALQAGYRHIDTAQFYANEESVGRAIRDSNIARSELFITTKILTPGSDVDSTYKSILESVKKLDGEDGYVDLYLIHSPNALNKEKRRMTWQALEKARESGKVRDIGLSNYGIGHIEEIKGFGKIWPPAVNQIELHPWCQQREIVEYCKKNSIVIEAYAPIVRNQKADDKTLNEVADKHNTSPNQVLIRYCLQKGWVPLPKSDTPNRIRKNVDVYGFELDEKDLKTLDDLDQGAEGAIVQAVNNAPQ